MRFYAVLATLCFVLGWVMPIEAGDLWKHWFPAKCTSFDCVGGYCCDDYCPKPPPCIVGPCSFQCDDYCPKCPPCIVGPCYFQCDDYCPKCPPILCCPPAPGLQCGPSDAKAPPSTPPAIDKPLVGGPLPMGGNASRESPAAPRSSSETHLDAGMVRRASHAVDMPSPPTVSALMPEDPADY